MKYLGRGPFEGEVISQAFGESKEKKTPYFELKVRIENRIITATQAKEAIEPVTRTIQLWCTPKAWPDTEEKLKKCGWPGGDPITLEPSAPGAYSFVGKRVMAWNSEEETQTSPYGKWNLSTGRVAEPRKSDASVAAKLSQMFGRGQTAQPAAPVPSSFSF